MKTRMLAGVACAALTVLSAPVAAATIPELPAFERGLILPPTPAVNAFYAARAGAPLWLRAGADSSAARELIGVLQRGPARRHGERPCRGGASPGAARASTRRRPGSTCSGRSPSVGRLGAICAGTRDPASGHDLCRRVGTPRRESAGNDPGAGRRCALARRAMFARSRR